MLLLDATKDGFLVIEDLTDRTLERALKEGVDRKSCTPERSISSRGCAPTRSAKPELRRFAGRRRLCANLTMLAVGCFSLGLFAAIYHPVGMAMLIEASGARGRTLAFNGVCGNLGVSLAAGISAALATWLGWRAAFLAPAALCVATGFVYLWLTPDDRHHAATRKSKPAVPLTPKLAVLLFGLFLVIAISAGLVFNVLTIALPKIVDERLAATCRWCWSAASPPPFWSAARWRN